MTKANRRALSEMDASFLSHRRQGLFQVLEKEIYHEHLFALTLIYPPSMDTVMASLQPGAFLHIMPPNVGGRHLFLRRPLSIAGIDRDQRTVLLIVKIIGDGTEQLSRVKPGDELDVYVPYTNGFPTQHLEHGARALLVGGGVGVAPLLWLAEVLHAQGVQITALMGFRESRDVIGLHTLKQLGAVQIVTEDGSSGAQGRVTDYMPRFSYDALFGCGPEPMLKTLAHLTAGDPRPHYVSLEARMACATGVCRACVVAVQSKGKIDETINVKGMHEHVSIEHRRVCHDGPVFQLSELVFA
ncbi:MAG: dihydroorotate dehydrogenase electron transfer subunit [Candidatus Carbobacillus sp.]|nr:dihydroorotate dehydrogenase electron transfer subunit [Candidatus Carbobacillus sp.]